MTSFHLNLAEKNKLCAWPFQTQSLKASHNAPNDYVRHQLVDGPINVTTLILGSSLAIITYVVLSTLREFLQIYQQKWQYLLEPNNFISWLLYISAAIMVSPVFNGGHITDVHFSATSITVFLSWFNLLLFLQRFDQVKRRDSVFKVTEDSGNSIVFAIICIYLFQVGIYVVMFLEILQTLIRVLLVFSILIIAFGLAFFIVFSKSRVIVGSLNCNLKIWRMNKSKLKIFFFSTKRW